MTKGRLNDGRVFVMLSQVRTADSKNTSSAKTFQTCSSSAPFGTCGPPTRRDMLQPLVFPGSCLPSDRPRFLTLSFGARQAVGAPREWKKYSTCSSEVRRRRRPAYELGRATPRPTHT